MLRIIITLRQPARHGRMLRHGVRLETAADQVQAVAAMAA